MNFDKICYQTKQMGNSILVGSGTSLLQFLMDLACDDCSEALGDLSVQTAMNLAGRMVKTLMPSPIASQTTLISV